MKFRRCYKLISSKSTNNNQYIYDSMDFTNSTISMSCVSVGTTTQITTNFEPENIECSINMINLENEERSRKKSSATLDHKNSIFKSNLIDTSSNNISSDPQEINPEIQKYYDNIYNIMNEMNLKYFEKEAPLELNIPDRIIRRVKKNISVFNENYRKMKSKQSYNNEGLNCGRIFDDVYRECIETLYHNTFSNYISYKREKINGAESKGSKEILDNGTENISIKKNYI